MNREDLRFLQRLFEKQSRKMRNIVARGVVSMVQDGQKMQSNQIQILDEEVIDGAERAQQYGFSSHPQAGAECFVVFVGADRAHPVILAVDDRRYRVCDSKPGEVVIYTDEGDKIELKRDNTVEITTKHLIIKAEEDVTVETKLLDIKANSISMSSLDGGPAQAAMEGSLAVSEDVSTGDVSLREHVHSGVQQGNDTSASPVGG